jgi:effector-binding domain-containing protein
MSPEPELRIPIGQFSFITRLSRRALRLYDEKGLLTPRRDRFNNYRYYTHDQIEAGLRIKVLGWMGFGCADIHELLGYLDDPRAHEGRIEEMFKRRLAETQMDIQRLKKVEEVLKGRAALEVLSMTATEPVIKNIPGMRVISKRGRGPVPQLIISMVQDICGQINSPSNQRGNVSIAGYPMTIYHDPAEEIDASNVDIEIAFPITGRISVDPGFEVKTVPAHKVVSVLHTGPYSECEGSYAKAMDFIGKNKLAVAGPFRELYMNSPEEVPESQLLTEIQVPIV